MAVCAPVFVVGMPRSGTKLLRDLLNQHPLVAIPEAETEFLPWLEGWISAHGQPESMERFAQLWSKVRHQQYFKYRTEAGMPIDPVDWHKACKGFDTAHVFEALIRVDTCRVGCEVLWGDKSPSYVDDLPLIARLYPDARVLHIVRDVRDYCASMRLAWGKHVLRAAQSWVDGIESARNGAADLGSRYLEVRYEDLLDDVEGVMRRICTHMALDFCPQMVTLQRPSENLGRAQGARHVARGNYGRYREALIPQEIRSIEAIAGHTLRALRYPVSDQAAESSRRLSRMSLRIYQAHDALRLLQFERRERGWIGAAMFHWRRYRAVHDRRAI